MKPDWSKHEVAGLAWDAIRDRLGAGAVAILPIGAGAKQHGFHMPVGTDQVFADYFSRALATEIDALIWPTLTYGAYPAFLRYAGSASLSNASFHTVVTEIADALISFGARRVLILNTGLSTIEPVDAAIGATRSPFAHSSLEGLRRDAVSADLASTAGAALWQPCRRDGDLADAGDCA
jgi:creatinine amidohydrolase